MGTKNVLRLIMGIDTQFYKYPESHRIVHYSQVNCMVYESCLDKAIKKTLI